MNISRWTALILLFVLVLTLGEGFAKGRISRDEAVESVRDRMGGRVISAETQEWDGRQIYNIRLLSKDGRVKRIRIDSQTGRQLKGPPNR